MPKAKTKKTSTEEENDCNTQNINVCVTCSMLTECEDVFILTFEDTYFINIFNICMGFKLSENSELKYICLDCIKTIISFHTFKETAIKSYEELNKNEAERVCTAEKDDLLDIDGNSNIDNNIDFLGNKDDIDENSEPDSNQCVIVQSDVKVELIEEEEVHLDNLEKTDGQDNNIWKCSYCPLTFSKNDPSEIKKHRLWKCRSNKDRLKQPIIKADDLLLCCLSCDFKSSSEDKFGEHFLTHKGSKFFNKAPRKFGCPKCEYLSLRKGDVERHLISHLEEDNVQQLFCNECSFSTRYTQSLHRHFKRKHQNETRRLKKRYICHKCDFQTAYKNTIMSHQLEHKRSMEHRTFGCDRCDFETIYRRNLKVHMNLHKKMEDRTKYVCEICGFLTIYRNRQRSHMMTHVVNNNKQQIEMEGRPDKSDVLHGTPAIKDTKIYEAEKDGEEYYFCGQCTFSTRLKGSFDSHVTRHRDPEDVKIHICDQCSFRTENLTALNRHLLRHKQEKKYACNACDYKTIYKSHLMIHRIVHKDWKDVAKLKCKHCEYRTAYRSNLVRHEKSHGKKRKRN